MAAIQARGISASQLHLLSLVILLSSMLLMLLLVRCSGSGDRLRPSLTSGPWCRVNLETPGRGSPRLDLFHL